MNAGRMLSLQAVAGGQSQLGLCCQHQTLIARAPMQIAPQDLLNHLNSRSPKYIFVDIFDTLVKRTIHPDDTKNLTSRLIARALGLPNHGDLLLRLRGVTERQMCLVNGEVHDELEFSFDEFPEKYFTNIRNVLPWIEKSDDYFRNLCYETERRVESLVLRRDDVICDALLSYKPQAAAIIGVSDFYLPRPFLNELIERAGVQGILDRLYVSCDEMRTKRSGRLYEHVLEDLGIDACDVVMIGDNAHSDGDMAKSNGIDSLVLDRATRRTKYEERRAAMGTVGHARNVFQGYARQAVAGTEPTRLFDELAVTLYLFVRRLHETAVSNQIDCLQFLAREGKFLRALFDAYQDGIGVPEDHRVSTEYLYVSRRATFPAVLRPIEEENFETLFRQYRELSAGMFLRSIGWPQAAVEAVARACQIDPECVEDDFPSSSAFECLLKSKEFQDAYDRYRQECQGVLTEYLDQARKDDQGRLVLVDVGWKGTIQDHLRRALPKGVDLWGIYLGMSGPGLVRPDNRKIPLLFSYTGALARCNKTFGAVRELFEAVMVADHGSVGGYARQKGKVVPVLDDQPEELQVYRDHVASLQDRLIKLVTALASEPAFMALNDASLEGLAEYLHDRIVHHPSPAEIQWYEAQKFYENFGTMALRSLADEADQVGLIGNARYLINPEPFEADAGEWKAADLHRRGLVPALTVRGWLARRANRDPAKRTEATVSELSDRVHEYAVALDRLTSMVLDREAESRGAVNLAVQRFAIMQDMDRAIAARDEAIRAQEARINDLQSAIASIEKLVEARDEVICNQTQLIADQSARLRKLEGRSK